MLRITKSYNTIIRLKELSENLRYLSAFNEKDAIEIERIDFVTPLSITPVSAIISEKQLLYKFGGETSSYLNVIQFPHGVGDLQNVDSGHTYIPIIHLSLENLPPIERTTLLSQLHSLFLQLLRENIIANEEFIHLITNNTFGFVMSEMLDNIEQHSHAKNVYLFAQYWANQNACEVCLLDDGIGLLGSLQQAGRDVYSHIEAVQKVIDLGLSAKTEHGEIIRGTGIKSTRRAITNHQIKGEFLLMSGNGAFLQTEAKKQFITLQSAQWKGTIVMMKLHKPLELFDLYNYIAI